VTKKIDGNAYCARNDDEGGNGNPTVSVSVSVSWCSWFNRRRMLMPGSVEYDSGHSDRSTRREVAGHRSLDQLNEQLISRRTLRRILAQRMSHQRSEPWIKAVKVWALMDDSVKDGVGATLAVW
jgi:hypothetical protein